LLTELVEQDLSLEVLVSADLGDVPLSSTGSAKVMRMAYFLRIICKVTAIKGEVDDEILLK
jgi:hypothetical protein